MKRGSVARVLCLQEKPDIVLGRIAGAKGAIMNLSVSKRVLMSLGLLLVLSGQAVAAPLQWTKVTPINGWKRGSVDTRAAAVAIDANDFVHLRGAIAQPPSGTSNIAFVLPVGFRPLATLLVPIALFSGQPGALQVEPNGVVTVAAAGPFSDARAFTSLEGVSFPRK
jgi:hypothetical protein